jgi:3-oxoacyl-[acyl-carrier protein] reductase
MILDQKAAIVTGGGTGVGRATALLLARGGCSVLINYSRSKEEAEGTAHEAEALGVKAIPWQADVADDGACRAMVDGAVKAFGHLDILVNNAATTTFMDQKDLEAVQDEDWDDIFAVNVKGTFQCARAARAALENSGSGEIVNTSSIAGIYGTGSSIPYCASKAAINNMTLVLARILAPKIRVNAVAPGLITGRWIEKGLGEKMDAVTSHFTDLTPLGRVCDPSEVGEAIVSFITGSDLVTGQILVCDGGYTLLDSRL